MEGTHTAFKSLILETFSNTSNKNFSKGGSILVKTALYLTFYQSSKWPKSELQLGSLHQRDGLLKHSPTEKSPAHAYEKHFFPIHFPCISSRDYGHTNQLPQELRKRIAGKKENKQEMPHLGNWDRKQCSWLMLLYK